MRKLRNSRAESGQVTAWTVGLSLLLFGIMTLTVDIGFWFLERRESQNNADAAALAAVQELPASNTTNARTQALNYLTKNGHSGGSVCTAQNSPTYTHFDTGVAFRSERSPSTDYETVRVCTSDGGLVIFGNLLGQGAVDIRAVAAATVDPGESNYAIFADHPCPDDKDTLLMPGQNAEVIGHVHTNCKLIVNGSDIDFNGGPVTYQETGAPQQWEGEGATPVGEGDGRPCPALCPREMPVPDPQTWQQVWTGSAWNTSVCDYVWSGKKVFDTSASFTNGTHCADEFDLSVSNVTRTVTLIARTGPLKMSGNNLTLTPDWTTSLGHPMLLFSHGDREDAIDISGQGNNWTGVIYAPLGTVKYQGSDGDDTPGSNFHSSIVAERVYMSGSNWNLTGIIGDLAGGEIGLIE